MAGRKPKPTHLKLVTGNPGKRAIPKHEPKPEIGEPPMPDWLADEAKTEWQRIMPELVRTGVIAKIDGSMLVIYCQLWAHFVEGEKKGSPLSAAHLTQIRALASSFGLEPSSRSRLVAGVSDAPKGSWDDL